jgi:hypothetical protein
MMGAPRTRKASPPGGASAQADTKEINEIEMNQSFFVFMLPPFVFETPGRSGWAIFKTSGLE